MIAEPTQDPCEPAPAQIVATTLVVVALSGSTTAFHVAFHSVLNSILYVWRTLDVERSTNGVGRRPGQTQSHLARGPRMLRQWKYRVAMIGFVCSLSFIAYDVSAVQCFNNVCFEATYTGWNVAHTICAKWEPKQAFQAVDTWCLHCLDGYPSQVVPATSWSVDCKCLSVCQTLRPNAEELTPEIPLNDGCKNPQTTVRYRCRLPFTGA